MTTTQSFRIYEILNRYLKNDSDARVVVQQIETVVDNKFNAEKVGLATKDDINRINLKITELIANQKRCFNNMIMWMIGMRVRIYRNHHHLFQIYYW